MPILVDGNNVIGQTPGWHRDKPGSRRRLLGELAAYASSIKARVSVVFDGAPDADAPNGSTIRGVRVQYPERGADADSVIERLVRMSKDPRGITVITSDRQLAADCRGLGAKVVASGDFRKQMAHAAARAGAPRDPGDEAQPVPGDTTDWLEWFGIEPGSE